MYYENTFFIEEGDVMSSICLTKGKWIANIGSIDKIQYPYKVEIKSCKYIYSEGEKKGTNENIDIPKFAYLTEESINLGDCSVSQLMEIEIYGLHKIYDNQYHIGEYSIITSTKPSLNILNNAILKKIDLYESIQGKEKELGLALEAYTEVLDMIENYY